MGIVYVNMSLLGYVVKKAAFVGGSGSSRPGGPGVASASALA